MASHDYGRLEEVLHPEYVAEWPQSRERVRGARNMQRIMEEYPGGRIDYDVEAEVLGDRATVRYDADVPAREDRRNRRQAHFLGEGGRILTGPSGT
jgi:hypothetical protein